MAINIVMSNYSKPLDISPEPLTLAGIAFMDQTKTTKKERHFRLGLNVSKHIRPKIVTLLDQCNLHIQYAELFYTPAHRDTLIHVDSEPEAYMIPNNMAKLNFIGGGEDSLMNWYDPLIDRPYESLGTQNKYISFDDHEVSIIARAKLSGYNIVQTGIPHSITTHTKSRYCVSITLAIKDKEPLRIPYELLVTLLDRYHS